jgi:hypothetical protein
MNRSWAYTLPMLLFVSATLIAQPISSADSPVQDRKPKSQSRTTGSSLTGCVDEQDGRYVLVDDRTLTPIANLEADGFPVEGFAKHMGHRVTVRGTSIPAGGSKGDADRSAAPEHSEQRPVFKVRTIETVSESCGPQK